jgi:hypothetical protein
VLETVRPKAQELALCVRSVDADTITAKVEISEAGRVTTVTLSPEPPYIVERCVVRIFEALNFPAAPRRSSHRLYLTDL